MKIIEASSQNYDDRPEGARIEYLIFHYTAVDFETSLKFLRFSEEPHRVSSHYLICEEGKIYKLVDETFRAWHAGESQWENDQMLNASSIGIELVNPGHGPHYHPFSEPQMKSLERLSLEIINRYSISPFKVLGHSDIAPLRKDDPGEFFDWRRFAHNGIGIMPPDNLPEMAVSTKQLFNLLQKFGYRSLKLTFENLDRLLKVFKMHYGGHSQSEIAARLLWLINAKADFKKSKKVK